MSLVWLVAVALFAWVVVGFAFALWLGRMFAHRNQRGGTLDLVGSKEFWDDEFGDMVRRRQQAVRPGDSRSA